MTPSIRPRTNISTDNLPAVREPPTTIIDNKMELDPKKVIDAWLASAEVLKTVAEAAREAQADNEYTRQTLEHSRKVMMRLGITIAVMQFASVLASWYLR